MENTFDRLINQIDAFIRKYYANEIVKGTLLFLGILLLSYLSISIFEYLGRFNIYWNEPTFITQGSICNIFDTTLR